MQTLMKISHTKWHGVSVETTVEVRKRDKRHRDTESRREREKGERGETD